MTRLSPRERVGYKLLFRNGLAAEEVALAMGMERNNVYQMKSRIGAYAREILEELEQKKRSK